MTPAKTARNCSRSRRGYKPSRVAPIAFHRAPVRSPRAEWWPTLTTELAEVGRLQVAASRGQTSCAARSGSTCSGSRKAHSVDAIRPSWQGTKAPGVGVEIAEQVRRPSADPGGPWTRLPAELLTSQARRVWAPKRGSRGVDDRAREDGDQEGESRPR